MTGRWQGHPGPRALPWWFRVVPGPMGRHPEGGWPGVMTHGHERAPWYAGMAPQVPTPDEWPEPPSPNVKPAEPGEAGVEWTDKRRPEKSDWRPPISELTRWGVEQPLDCPTNQGPDTVAHVELSRVELPLPTGTAALVWARKPNPTGASLIVEVQLLVGLGTTRVPVTEWVALTIDGVARLLQPRDARNPAQTSEVMFPAASVYVTARFQPGQPAPGGPVHIILGSMVAPVSSLW